MLANKASIKPYETIALVKHACRHTVRDPLKQRVCMHQITYFQQKLVLKNPKQTVK